jgi:RNA polymerase sigma factor (sigma-70 family)
VVAEIYGSVNERTERFRALYLAHYRAIYAYVYRRMTSQSSHVPDVVAEVFTVAWRRLDSVPAGGEELLWLYGVAHRCVLRAQRGDWRRLRLLRRLAEHARTSPAGASEGAREEEVREAVERLPPVDREVLRLVMWDGLSHSEAAAILDCSVNAVAQRLHTARERLRQGLTEGPVGQPEMLTRSDAHGS